MAKLTEQQIGHKIAPAKKPELLPSLPGYMKVRLTYLTAEPKHVRNLMLQIQGIQAPYFEDVCVLFPCGKTYDLLENYMPAFAHLQEAGLVSSTAKLQSHKLLTEDDVTLAYVF